MMDDWKDMVRIGMVLIKKGCEQNEGMCNNCPFFMICDPLVYDKSYQPENPKFMPSNWDVE